MYIYIHIYIHTVIFCCSSVTKSCLTFCDPMNYSMPGFCVLHYFPSLPKLMSIESVMPSHHLILCCALLLLPSIYSTNRVLHQLTKVVELQLQLQSPSSDHPRLICFRIDSFDLHVVQGTLKSLLQHHDSKESIL